MAIPADRTQPSRELLLRILSAAVLIPVALAAAVFGGAVFAVAVAVVMAVVQVEWGRMTRGRPAWGPFDVGTALAIVAMVVAIAFTLMDQFGFAAVAVAAGALLVAATTSGGPSARGLAASGVAYASVPAVAVVAIREGVDGLDAVIFLLAVVWATDIAGYVGGRTIGGPKLWPAVSPKKTWAGAISGIAGALLVAWVLAEGPAPLWIVWAIGLSAASQLGDLGESALKRRCGIKDSGAIIPGHGGVMDRVDGLIAAAVVGGLVQVATPAFALGRAIVGAGW